VTRSLPELRRSPALTSNVTRRADVSAMRAVRAHDVQLDCCHILSLDRHICFDLRRCYCSRSNFRDSDMTRWRPMQSWSRPSGWADGSHRRSCGMHTTGEWGPSPRSRAGGRGGGPSGRSSGPSATVPRLKVKANTSDLAGAGIERTR
jgi:hypothetical protein